MVQLAHDKPTPDRQVPFLAAAAVAAVRKHGLQPRSDRRPVAVKTHVHVVQSRVRRRTTVGTQTPFEDRSRFRRGGIDGCRRRDGRFPPAAPREGGCTNHGEPTEGGRSDVHR